MTKKAEQVKWTDGEYGQAGIKTITLRGRGISEEIKRKQQQEFL